jgi:hypothetical protein
MPDVALDIRCTSYSCTIAKEVYAVIARRSRCEGRYLLMPNLRFAQSPALGRKVSDEFTVPLCRDTTARSIPVSIQPPPRAYYG